MNNPIGLAIAVICLAWMLFLFGDIAMTMYTGEPYGVFTTQ